MDDDGNGIRNDEESVRVEPTKLKHKMDLFDPCKRKQYVGIENDAYLGKYHSDCEGKVLPKCKHGAIYEEYLIRGKHIASYDDGDRKGKVLRKCKHDAMYEDCGIRKEKHFTHDEDGDRIRKENQECIPSRFIYIEDVAEYPPELLKNPSKRAVSPDSRWFVAAPCVHLKEQRENSRQRKDHGHGPRLCRMPRIKPYRESGVIPKYTGSIPEYPPELLKNRNKRAVSPDSRQFVAAPCVHLKEQRENSRQRKDHGHGPRLCRMPRIKPDIESGVIPKYTSIFQGCNFPSVNHMDPHQT